VLETLHKQGYEAMSASSEAYTQQLAKEREHWGPIVAASGFKSEE
jgi:tripartite-type tricarboxylate transporter receptor subunit TctC